LGNSESSFTDELLAVNNMNIPSQIVKAGIILFRLRPASVDIDGSERGKLNNLDGNVTKTKSAYPSATM